MVAIGGGSTIDFAKALAVTGDNVQNVINQVMQGSANEQNAKPLIAVPTTAGTGSEVTPWATLWDLSAQAKHSLHDGRCWAEAAFVDPQLIGSCPHNVALASALDALSHALESVWNRNANPVSDALALQAAKGIVAALPIWLSTKNDAARNTLSQSALLAGMAFSQTKTALAHAMSYDITMRLGVAHGIACSFSLPEVWRRAVVASPERMRVIEPLFGTLSDTPLATFLQTLGVSTQFADYGINDIDVEVARQLHSPRGQNFIGAASHA